MPARVPYHRSRPRRELIGGKVVDGLQQGRSIHPARLRHLQRVGRQCPAPPPDDDVIELMLDESAAQLSPVHEIADHREIATDDPQFIAQPAPSSVLHRLSRTRMTAARVRPQPTRVILPRRAPLQQDSTAVIEQHDGHGAMQAPIAMRVELRRDAHDGVVLVDQHDDLVSVAVPVERRRGHRLTVGFGVMVAAGTRCLPSGRETASRARARVTLRSAPPASMTLRDVVV